MKLALRLIILCCYSSIVNAQFLFDEIKPSYEHKTLQLAPEFEYEILFREGDIVYLNDQKTYAPSKEDQDFIAFIPGKTNKQASLYISHETNDSSTILGDGGGGTLFNMVHKKGTWSRNSAFYHVDFSPVKFTTNNCGGVYIPEKNILLSAEEFPFNSNKDLHKRALGIRDTSDVNNIKAFEHSGWMVQIDPSQRKAIKKLYALGRFSHESAALSKDGKTLYMTDDNAPSVLFKFECEKAFQFEQGTLYAYSETFNNQWIALPNDTTSLIHARQIAIDKGASIFMRMEWMTLVGEKLYITETGTDEFYLQKQNIKPQQLAQHLMTYVVDSVLYYPFGSILCLDVSTNIIKPLLRGGQGMKFKDKHFSNPDAITHVKIENHEYLVVCEDLIGKDKFRAGQEKNKEYINEVWFLNLDIANPCVDDLQRFIVAPPGAECTGVCFSPDGETLFLNVQHPSKSNEYPFDKTCTIAIHLKKRQSKRKPLQKSDQGFGVGIPF